MASTLTWEPFNISFKPFKNVFIFNFIYLSVLPAAMYVHHRHAWCTWRSEKGIGSWRTGVVEGCELSYGFWEWNPVLLEEHPVFSRWVPSPAPYNVSWVSVREAKQKGDGCGKVKEKAEKVGLQLRETTRYTYDDHTHGTDLRPGTAPEGCELRYWGHYWRNYSNGLCPRTPLSLWQPLLGLYDKMSLFLGYSWWSVGRRGACLPSSNCSRKRFTRSCE